MEKRPLTSHPRLRAGTAGRMPSPAWILGNEKGKWLWRDSGLEEGSRRAPRKLPLRALEPLTVLRALRGGRSGSNPSWRKCLAPYSPRGARRRVGAALRQLLLHPAPGWSRRCRPDLGGQGQGPTDCRPGGCRGTWRSAVPEPPPRSTCRGSFQRRPAPCAAGSCLGFWRKE